MNHINQEMLAKRLMRDVVSGPPDAEKAPTKFCQGRLANGRPCMITVLHGDYCLRHQKEIDALEAGAPLQPGRVERPFEERIEMAKKGICKVCGKKDTQIIGAGMCYHCRKAAIEAGTYPEPANIVPVKPEPVAQEQKLSDVIIDADKQIITYEDDQEKAALAGGPIPAATDHVAGADKLIEKPVVCLQCEGPVEGQDLFCRACAPAGFEIPPVATTPPQEQAEPLAGSVSPLSRLLRKLEPAVQPLPPTSILLDFTDFEFSAIQSSEITAEHIKELTLMLVNGELGKVVEVEDPLAKSRQGGV